MAAVGTVMSTNGKLLTDRRRNIEPSQTLQVIVPISYLNKIDNIATETDRSRSYVVRKLIIDSLQEKE